jgi:hypothetical protein
VSPLDSEEHWLEAGITGLSRQREWDAVATVTAPGEPGEEAVFVVLADARILLEDGQTTHDVTPFAEAVRRTLPAPFRATAVRRDDVWAIGACAIEVERLEPDPTGDELELTSDGSTATLVADGLPVPSTDAAALERLAAARESGPYAAVAHRLADDLFEISVLPL